MALPRKKTSNRTSGRFASGFLSPLQGDGLGGFALSEGEQYIRQQVLTAVFFGDTNNPFQGELVVGEQAIFENPTDPAWQTEVRRVIQTNFEFLEENNLAKLIRVEFTAPSVEARSRNEFALTVTYINLETGREGSENIESFSQGDDANLLVQPTRRLITR